MASFVSGQDEPNRAFLLAIQVGGQDGAILPTQVYPLCTARKILKLFSVFFQVKGKSHELYGVIFAY